MIDTAYRALAVAKVEQLHPGVDADAAVQAALTWLADSARPAYPGPVGDAGWHGLILASTHRYAELCEQVAGRFVHHEATGDDCRGRGCQGCRHDPCEELAP